MMRVWRLFDDVWRLSRTSGLSREQRGLGRRTWLGHHFQGQNVKGQGHQAALVGCSSHHVTCLDANSLCATAQSHHLHGAGAYCGGLPHSCTRERRKQKYSSPWLAPCGFRGWKNRPAPFRGRMSYTRRLNQILSVLSLSLGFVSVTVLLLTMAHLLRCVILCYLCVPSLGCSC